MGTEVIVMRAVSGGGKSTWVRDNYPHARVFSTDFHFEHYDPETEKYEYRFRPEDLGDAYNNCLLAYVSYLEKMSWEKGDFQVVVDNTNCSIAEMAPYAALALAHGARLKVVTLNCPVEVAAARTTHGVPRVTIEQMAAALAEGTKQMPARWTHEQHDVG